MRVTAETRTAERGAELLSNLTQARFLHYKNHADERIRQRDGLSFAVVEDMVLRPYGKIYYNPYRKGSYAIHDPAIIEETDQSRAVIVVVEGATAMVITAYNVEDPDMYEQNAEYEFLADCR